MNTDNAFIFIGSIKFAGNEDRHKISDTSSNSGQIRPVTLELLALERLKKCEHNSAFIFGRMFIKLAGNKNRHKILDDRSDYCIRFGVTLEH